jgi:hypothetical protein
MGGNKNAGFTKVAQMTSTRTVACVILCALC